MERPRRPSAVLPYTVLGMSHEKYRNADEALRAALALPDAQALSLTLPPALLSRDPRLEQPRFLGRGGMGSVYRAFDRSLGREVAVKLVRPGRGQEELVKRLRREAQALSALRHPNIVELVRIDETDGQILLVMAFEAGLPLRKVLRGRLPLDRALSLVVTVGDALCAAHDKGFVHRDVKPENIMVRPDGSPCLLDFGLARGVQSELGLATFTRPGELLGTSRYMAPEQLRGERGDVLSDQYAFGLTAYETLHGKYPDAAQAGDGTVPALVCDVLQRCMAELPERRFASLREAVDTLARLSLEESALRRP